MPTTRDYNKLFEDIFALVLADEGMFKEEKPINFSKRRGQIN